MRQIAFLLVAVVMVAGVVAPGIGHADQQATPIFVTNIPPGYRDWRLISLAHEEGNLNSLGAIGQSQSFIAGPPTNIQFMVKDSKKYATTGGWGFAHFQDGKPREETLMKTCFPCHDQVKARDLVFTRYAP